MKLLRNLLWKLGGFEARFKQQELRRKTLKLICMDELNGWLKTCVDSKAPEVRV